MTIFYYFINYFLPKEKAMDKQNILQQLQQLTTTEEIALKKTQTLPYNYEDFKKVYTEKNEPIYQNTFLVSYENDRRIADFLRQASS